MVERYQDNQARPIECTVTAIPTKDGQGVAPIEVRVDNLKSQEDS